MRKRKSNEFSPSSSQQQNHSNQVYHSQQQQQPASTMVAGTINVGAGGMMRVVPPQSIYSGQSAAGRSAADNGGPMGVKDVMEVIDSGEFMSGGGDTSMTSNGSNNGGVILEQDRFLPIANINRIMKSVLPAEGKLSKEAKECVQECITEFLLFITSEASEKCTTERRKTITGEDLLMALQTLGFDDYVEPLREFLQKYRDANRVISNVKEDCGEFDTVMQMHHQEDGTVAALVPSTSSATVIYHQQGGTFHHQENEPVHLQQHQQHHFQQIYSGNGHTNATAVSQQNNRISPLKQQQRTSHPQQLQLVNTTPQPQQQPTTSQPQFLVPNTLQPMQMFVDAATGQHYVCTQGADGSQSLVAVNLTPAAQPSTQNATDAAPPATIPPPAPRKRPGAGRSANKTNGSTSFVAAAPNSEQSVRHYLQSQAEFKLRKTAATDK